MIEINIKIEICESTCRTPTLGTLSMIKLDVGLDFVNINFIIFNSTAIFHKSKLQYLIVHTCYVHVGLVGLVH